MKNLVLTDSKILINGNETKIISGSIHYFRIVKEQWKDRLLKMKECGLNCIETYVPWNLHEKVEGSFDFEGNLDLGEFLDLANDLGLYAIVRPGPFICSEWDFGGFPWWLLKYKSIHLRCSDPLYLEKITPYLNKVSKILRKRTINNGGNVLFVQIENEYGCYGSDKVYLNYIKSIYNKNKLNVEFLTSDNDSELLQKNGGLDGVLHTVNYRWDSVKCIGILKKYCPNQIGAVMELWNGHAEHYNEDTPKRDLKEVGDSISNALKNAELVNMYMFSGGTSFGFMNGSMDFGGNLIVQKTSYDTEAPINEYGQRTPKYYIEQKAIHDFLRKEVQPSKCNDVILKDFGKAKFIAKSPLNSLIDVVGHTYEFGYVPTMEETDYGYGYIQYETEVFIGKDLGNLIMPQVHDIAHLYVDGDYKKTFYRNNKDNMYAFESYGKHQIKILVENMGRVNFGRTLKDFKGLVGDIIIEDMEVHMKPFANNFKVTSIPLDKVPSFIDSPVKLNEASFYKYSINIDNPEDTLIKVNGFTRGVIFVNGINIGRHWDVAFNSNKLYVPKQFLRVGLNEIIVFDVLENENKKEVEFVNE